MPSIRLTKEFLGELVDILSNEETDIKQKGEHKTYYLDYIIQEKDRRLKTKDKDNFINRTITRNLKYIAISLYSTDKTIMIIIQTGIRGGSNVTIEGENTTWVYGVSRVIENVFKKYKTFNDFFYSKKCALFYILVGSIIGLGYGSVFKSPLSPIINFIIQSSTFSVDVFFISIWLFQKVESEYSRHVKIRKAILGIIGTVLVGLLVKYISQLLGH